MDISSTLNENHYIIDGDNQVPNVILDKKQNIFEFSGVSIPEDAINFYAPIIDWFDLYKSKPIKRITVLFKLNYINSASSKMIDRLLQKLNEIHLLGNYIEIQWYYHIDDEDMLMDGKIFLESKAMPYELINYGTSS